MCKILCICKITKPITYKELKFKQSEVKNFQIFCLKNYYLKILDLNKNSSMKNKFLLTGFKQLFLIQNFYNVCFNIFFFVLLQRFLLYFKIHYRAKRQFRWIVVFIFFLYENVPPMGDTLRLSQPSAVAVYKRRRPKTNQ